MINRITEVRLRCLPCDEDVAMAAVDGDKVKMREELSKNLRKRTQCDHDFEVLL